jgi:hypothetical protein
MKSGLELPRARRLATFCRDTLLNSSACRLSFVGTRKGSTARNRVKRLNATPIAVVRMLPRTSAIHGCSADSAKLPKGSPNERSPIMSNVQ